MADLARGVSISIPRIALLPPPLAIHSSLAMSYRIGVRHHVHEMPCLCEPSSALRCSTPWLAIVCIGRFPRVVALNQLVPLNVISLRTPFQ